MKTLLIVISGIVVIIGIFTGFTIYSYLNYAQMTIVRLDNTVLMQQAEFVDVPDNVTMIPKLQQSMQEVGNKYDSILKKCTSNNGIQGYCNGLPINAIFSTIITANEFHIIDKAVQLKPLGISGNGTWFSYLKYHHQGCFPLAHGFQLEPSKSDNYCYYSIIVEKK